MATKQILFIAGGEKNNKAIQEQVRRLQDQVTIELDFSYLSVNELIRTVKQKRESALYMYDRIILLSTAFKAKKGDLQGGIEARRNRLIEDMANLFTILTEFNMNTKPITILMTMNDAFFMEYLEENPLFYNQIEDIKFLYIDQRMDSSTLSELINSDNEFYYSENMAQYEDFKKNQYPFVWTQVIPEYIVDRSSRFEGFNDEDYVSFAKEKGYDDLEKAEQDGIFNDDTYDNIPEEEYEDAEEGEGDHKRQTFIDILRAKRKFEQETIQDDELSDDQENAEAIDEELDLEPKRGMFGKILKRKSKQNEEQDHIDVIVSEFEEETPDEEHVEYEEPLPDDQVIDEKHTKEKRTTIFSKMKSLFKKEEKERNENFEKRYLPELEINRYTSSPVTFTGAIGVIGQEGSGATTSAINIAEYFAQFNKTVLYLDFDFVFGSSAYFYEDVIVKANPATMSEYINRQATVDDLVVNIYEDVVYDWVGSQVPFRNEHEGLAEEIRLEVLIQLINDFRESYDVVVVDIPFSIAEAFPEAVHHLNHVLFVTENTQTAMEFFMREMHDLVASVKDKSLIINKYNPRNYIDRRTADLSHVIELTEGVYPELTVLGVINPNPYLESQQKNKVASIYSDEMVQMDFEIVLGSIE
ncbi:MULTISPECIES: AAA family ATPase [Bacillus amyloliquefaciens group]|uniref:AAA family ATPase n=1 Tax=Bacillus amyloliquefaciens group TaxID=1938374 RepID=UPI00226E65E6|nr:AAA family ATPase [Bacillus velezensis]MCY0092253.1 AAA family ATPase [Bacillus velezensis]